MTSGNEGLKPTGTEKVLLDEYAGFWPEDKNPPADEESYRLKAFDNGQAALCLSGGGIRSASFALGVMQALATKRLLTGFHYLSTVSGGGYIGGWLQRWIYEDGDAGRVMTSLARVKEPAQVAALRENSNFITPRVGIGSNDTWTAISISGRNIALNWLLFAPLLMLVTVFPNLFVASVESLPRRSGDFHELAIVPVAISAVFAWTAAWFVCRGLPSYRAETKVVPGNADGWLTTRIVLPLVLWSIAGTLSIANDIFRAPTLVVPGGALTLVSFVASLLGLLASGATLKGAAHRATFGRDVALWITALLFGAAVTLLGAGMLFRWLGEHPIIGTVKRGLPSLSPGAVLATVGPLWLMGTQLLIAIVFAGFRKATGRTVQPDGDREWLARLSAVKIKPMLLWATVAFAVLILDWTLAHYIPGYDMSLSGFVAVLSGSAAVAGGRSDKSGSASSTTKGIASSVLKHLPLQGVIAVGTAIFILILFLVLGRVEHHFASWTASGIERLEPPRWADPLVLGHFAVFGVLVGLLLFFRRKIQVNRFSLNGLYRNRLSRAFLGGARRSRTPDPFTGFDPADNVRMHSLAPSAAGRTCLYPVINVALNVTASEKLAWQERRAEPFVFTPLYSGSAMLRPPSWPPQDGRAYDLSEPPGAYLKSNIYGGNEPDLGMEGCGVTLATAVSISGAAATPNMGYHTSAATALLMTLFNVRLGAWLPNPAQAEEMGDLVSRSGPNDSLRAILRELGGATDDRGWDIYLSDGGHFENLGLYEMVRRRCRYILISDAAADPNCSFQDLGNAVRKVKIDLDVDVAFGELRISGRHNPISPQFAYALGTIEYPEQRYGGAGEEDEAARRERIGRILYVKPSFFGELPVDVRSYAATSETFPHESTADQFFSESQFESYRRLGYFFTSTLGGGKRHASIAAFFDAVEAEYDKARQGAGGVVGRAVRAVRRRVRGDAKA
jgi:hypothetical protein